MSSPMLSTQSTPTQRVPAWKRLGLKLKPASENSPGDSSPATSHRLASSSSASVPNNYGSLPSSNGGNSASAKRKPSTVPALDFSAKRVRRESSDNTPSSNRSKPLSKKPKSVSFTAETKALSVNAADGTRGTNKQNQSIATKKPAKPLAKKKQTNVNLGPSLEYLRLWHSARDQWKFNKNHQTRLLESAFGDGNTIPAVDINIFYEYIKPLKGYVRSRLQQSAVELQKMDVEQGADGFLAKSNQSKEAKEAAEKRQREYEETIAGFLTGARTPEKRRFEEVEYVLRTADMEMQRRVVKRMRAEMVLEELSESEESTVTTTTTTTTTAETETGKGSAEGTSAEADGDKRVKLNDGSQQRVKRKRKVRTTEVDDESSSSDSEDEADSETSSSDSSSEDSDDDEEMQGAPLANADDTSSSSSSSSSEDEDEDEEGDDSGGDDDDEDDD